MPPSPHHLPGLPDPSPDEAAFSERATERLRIEIAKTGSIPFSRFMELALYQSEFGYYTGGTRKFGPDGDFITAPETYPLFSRCLARAVAPLLAELGEDARVLEVGAGSGKLAAVLLNELDALGVSPTAYDILDLSPDLRRRQEETIRTLAPAAHARVHWLNALPEPGFRGVIIANELLDAMPVERFRCESDGIRQLRVTWQENRFAWMEAPASEAVCERIAPLQLPPHYVSEIGFAAEAWIRSTAEILGAGVLLLIDYGFPRAEFYHPDRSSGTLMCHYRHRAHDDPLRRVGLQDITSHVDFTAIAEAGISAGLDLLGYTSQAAFLIGAGLEQIVAASDPSDTRAHLALTQQIKKLTLPHEMGELYKVIAVGREMSLASPCFLLNDRRDRL